MTTITIKKGNKKDVALLLDMAKRLDIDFTVEESRKLSYTEKQKAIKELSKEINRNMTKRMYADKDMPLP